MPLEIVYLFPIVVLAYTSNAMIGFGAPLIAVTLGANVMPVELLVPSLVPLSVIAPGFIAFRYRRKIHKDLLLKQILPFMGCGLIIGLVAYPYLKAFDLKRVLGAMVVVLSAKALIPLVKGQGGTSAPPNWVSGCTQVIAGVIQAVYITGGPLLVYSISRTGLDKGAFRATLCAVWVTLNSILLFIFICNGRVNCESINVTLPLLAAAPIGIILGVWIHKRLETYWFQVIVYTVLMGAGIKLVIF
jgi:uncharacterized protein